jgi:hypothetical protein
LINCSFDESGMVVGLETSDNALIIGLDMCCEVWLEVVNSNTSETIRNDMPREVVLKEKYLLVPCMDVPILLKNPILIELSSHPCLCIISVIQSQLSTHLFLECSRTCCFPDDKRLEHIRTISICCECICQLNFFPFDSCLLMV